MNRITLFGTIVLAAAATTSAFADDITIDPHPFVSTRTQAEVQAELAEFKRSGANPWSTAYNPLKYFKSSRTRAEVERNTSPRATRSAP